MINVMWNNSFQDVDTGYDFDFNYEAYKEEHDRRKYDMIDDGSRFHFASCPVCGNDECVVLLQHKSEKTFKVQCEACELETEDCRKEESAVRDWENGVYTIYDEKKDEFVSIGRKDVEKALTSSKSWWEAVLE